MTGRIADAKNVAIKGAVCKLKNDKDSILTYAITNVNGVYALPFFQKGKLIEISHISYETQRISLQPNQYKYDIMLSNKVNELKEVVVLLDPIRRAKDTLNYNVASFKKQEDVSIEDVIKRLPGIEVDATGEITYQGKSINKLNIEGLDLMGNKYNQATQNMPAEAVSQIQVMENNQPIRVLNGKGSNNHATLNIKLKKGYKLRPFGEIEGGVGNHHIWEGTATAIEFSPHNQWLITGTLDNRGIGLSVLTKEMANYDRMYTNEPLPLPFLTTTSNRTLPISPLYFLKNKSYFTGINYLHAFNEYSNIRVNLLYNHEDEIRTDSLMNHHVAKDTITIFQRQNLNAQSDVLKGQIRYELNNSKLFIEDILTAEHSWIKNGKLYHTQTASIDENVRRQPMFFQNIINSHFTLGNQTLTLSSVI
ncbi:MAG: carboxypeptidase-like regulatory domain-containing protein, partial [Candidatus Coprenecus sp.]|nr:carboxypeptidase-like regulatory domain-containing protein [Candidatus Coprenecus sp.]